jgi:hypothetical protein
MRLTSTWITIAAAVAAVTVSACGAEKPSVCDSLAAVETSLDHVRNANVSENGLSQLTADLNYLRADLIQLRTDAQAQFPTEIDAVRTAVNQVSASIAAARATPDAGTIGAVRPAVSAVQDSVRHLADAMSGTC